MRTPSRTRHSHRRAQCAERRQLGSEGGCAEKARYGTSPRSLPTRIESGERGFRAAELRQLLTEYGVDTVAQDMLAALSDWREIPGWWLPYMKDLPSAHLAHVIPEAFASQSLIYAPNQIPALLRIREYDEAVVAADPGTPKDREDMTVRTTSARQQVVLHERRTRLVVVIGEAALRQQIGGPKVLNEQLMHLAELCGIDWITIRVMPFGAGAHAAGGTGGFSILQFDDIPELAIVHQDGPAGGLCPHEPEITEAYATIFRRLYSSATGPAESARKIIQMANR